MHADEGRFWDSFWEWLPRIAAVLTIICQLWVWGTFVANSVATPHVPIGVRASAGRILLLAGPFVLLMLAIAIAVSLWHRRRRGIRRKRLWFFLALVVIAAAGVTLVPSKTPSLRVVDPSDGDIVGPSIAATVKYRRLGEYRHVYVVVQEPESGRCWIDRRDLGGSPSGRGTAYSVPIGGPDAGVGKKFTIFAIATKAPPEAYDGLALGDLPRDSLTSGPIQIPRRE